MGKKIVGGAIAAVLFAALVWMYDQYPAYHGIMIFGSIFASRAVRF
jgi:hypothetical protein